MLKGLLANSMHVTVSGAVTRPYINMSNLSAGQLRYNGNINSIEAYDGNTWYVIDGFQSVDVSESVKEILNWAYEKMQQERKINAYAARFPLVKSAKERLDMIMALIGDVEDENDSI
jgi:hypothetical protein